jgi:hypothetical protein
MTTLEAQFRREEAYVTYFHARIVSGAYKERLGCVFHGIGNDNPFTELELLNDEVDSMQRHIESMSEIITKMFKQEHKSCNSLNDIRMKGKI